MAPVKVASKAVDSKAPKVAKELKHKAKDAVEKEEAEVDIVEEEEENAKASKTKAAKVEAPKTESEEQIKAARKKDLKAMPAVDLKALLESKSLKTGKKEEMIETLVKAEAKVRAEVRAHEVKVRAVLEQIKKDLEAKPAPELKELCVTKGLKTGGDKTEKVARLLELANKEGEVEKVMAQNARNARREVLASMEKQGLVKHCEKAKIDPLVQEVMVERLFSHELATGSICPPKPAENSDCKVDKAKLEKKMAEFKAMGIDELKKLSQKEGLEVGKKDTMVAALLSHAATAEAEVARKKELKALGKDELKELVKSKCLPAGNVQAMVETLLAHEAKKLEEVQKQKVIEKEVVAKKAEEFSSKTIPELKDLCVAKGLKIGGGKEEKVERLVEAAREAGEIDQVLLAMTHASRREELNKLDKVSLKALCDRAGLDTIIKEIMVERIISSEFDAVAQPAAKKARLGA